MDLILVKDPLIFEDDERIPSVFRPRENRVGPLEFSIIALKHNWKESILLSELLECCTLSKQEALNIIELAKRECSEYEKQSSLI